MILQTGAGTQIKQTSPDVSWMGRQRGAPTMPSDGRHLLKNTPMIRQIFEYDPRLGHRYIPDLKARVPHASGGYLVRTNCQGFRYDRDFEKTQPSGSKRILLFGDSYTAGESVSNGKRYSDFLERNLSDLTVFNFAIPATGTDQQYLAFEEFANGMEHDLLMIAPLVENIRRNVSAYRMYADQSGRPIFFSKPYYELVDGKLHLRGVPPDPIGRQEHELPKDVRVDVGGPMRTARELIHKLGLERVAKKVVHYDPVPEYKDPQHPAWLLMREILKRWIESSSKPVLLMPIPLRQHYEDGVDATSYLTRFAELSEETGCEMHDPLQALLAYPLPQRRAFRFEGDWHFNPEGHAVIARSLQPTLVRLLAGDA